MSLANNLIAAGPMFMYPETVGQAYGGGFWAGNITVDGLVYAIVVSPKTGGDGVLVYRTSGTAFTGNTSTNDGWLIRNNMIAAGISDFPAQQGCMSLTLGGYTDWYLPSKDELEIVYRFLKPTTTSNVTSSGINPSSVPPKTTNYTTTNPQRTTVTAFRSTGTEYLWPDFYLSATQGSGGSTHAHHKLFGTGADGTILTSTTGYNVRAIRRVLLR